MITVKDKEGNVMSLRQYIRLDAGKAAKETKNERYGRKNRT